MKNIDLLGFLMCFLSGAIATESIAFGEVEFKRRLQNAITRTKQLLYDSKNPIYTYSQPDSVSHTYEDKFALAEYLTSSSISATWTVFNYLGFSSDDVSLLKNWSSSSVVLKFNSSKQFTYDHYEIVEQELPFQQKTVQETDDKVTSTTTKVVHVQNRSFWKVDLEYHIEAQNVQSGESKKLVDIHDSAMVSTDSSSAPYHMAHIPDPADLDISWLLQHSMADHASILQPQFHINRNNSKCKTPRRNDEISEAMDFFVRLYKWNQAVRLLVFDGMSGVYDIGQSFYGNLNEIARKMFVPVFPVYQSNVESESIQTATISEQGNAILLADHVRSLNEMVKSVEELISATSSTFAGAITNNSSRSRVLQFNLLSTHMTEISSHFASGVDYVENMLREQIRAAIGKELTSDDVSEYMEFHNHGLFAEEYVPKYFTYAIRRSDDASPEGFISLESTHNSKPIRTHVNHFRETILDSQANSEIVNVENKQNKSVISFNLNPSTKVQMFGDVYLHSWMHHSFSSDQVSPSLSEQFNVIVRARQFSSFILVLGTLTSPTDFEPIHAIIVKDKDYLKIPLEVSMIPTAKEFRTATLSLSPEQKRFAEAFRSMQLGTSIYAVCTIQIKPQLEKILNLSPETLTKEIKLTRDLIELFLDYQIPSDLLSYSGRNVDAKLALREVSDSVAAMKAMIADEKKLEIEEEKRVHEFHNPAAFGSVKIATGSGMAMNLESGEVDGPVAYRAKRAYSRGASRNAPSMLSAEEDASMDFHEGVFIRSFACPTGAPAIPPAVTSSMRMMTEELLTPVSLNSEVLSQGKSLPTEGKTLDEAAFKPLSGIGKSSIDLTSLPQIMDNNFDVYSDGVIRAAKIKTMEDWSRRRQRALLSDVVEARLSSSDVKDEKDKAFDLIDALTRSGGISIDHASLHLIVSSVHCFGQTVLETVVQENINPIDQLEQSSIIAASTIHRISVPGLLKDDRQRERIKAIAPSLLELNKK